MYKDRPLAKYILSKSADADLENIYKYTFETWGIEQFHIYRKQINDALEKISKEPELINSKAREDLAPGCRLYHVQHHYIVYRLGKKYIEVGRILHERMNVEKQVSDDVFPKIKP